MGGRVTVGNNGTRDCICHKPELQILLEVLRRDELDVRSENRVGAAPDQKVVLRGPLDALYRQRNINEALSRTFLREDLLDDGVPNGLVILGCGDLEELSRVLEQAVERRLVDRIVGTLVVLRLRCREQVSLCTKQGYIRTYDKRKSNVSPCRQQSW